MIFPRNKMRPTQWIYVGRRHQTREIYPGSVFKFWGLVNFSLPDALADGSCASASERGVWKMPIKQMIQETRADISSVLSLQSHRC